MVRDRKNAVDSAVARCKVPVQAHGAYAVSFPCGRCCECHTSAHWIAVCVPDIGHDADLPRGPVREDLEILDADRRGNQ